MVRKGCLALVFMFCLGLIPAHADFLISFDPVTFISSGGNGYVNVYISSTAGTMALQNTNFEFALSTTGATRLEFLSSPPASSDPTFASSNYVFAGDSLVQNVDSQLGTNSTDTVPNDRFTGGDATFTGNDVMITAIPKLLAMLPVTAVTGLPPVGGDSFTISLVPTSGSGFVSPATGFGDSLGNFFPFTSTSGSIVITPEPSALVLVGAGVGLALLVGRRRARTCAAAR